MFIQGAMFIVLPNVAGAMSIHGGLYRDLYGLFQTLE